VIDPLKHLADSGRLEQTFINGEWTMADITGRSSVIDPSTEETLAEIALIGAYKCSGNGREYGIEGLEEYLQTKAVVGFDFR